MTIGILESPGASLLHPNPSAGSLFINSARPARAEFLEASGRVAWSTVIRAGNNQLDLPEHLVNGSYVLRLLQVDGATSVHRFGLIR